MKPKQLPLRPLGSPDDCFPLEIVTPSEARCSLDEVGAYRLVMRGDWRKDKDLLSLILTLLRSFGYAVPHVWMIEEAENERAEKL